MGKLELNLDSLYEEGYYYTNYDIGGCGHKIVIDSNDKEVFLDAFAKEWREKAENLLEPFYEDDED